MAEKPDLSKSFVGFPWRTGHEAGRTIYVQLHPDPSYTDPLIGVMDSPELAEQVVVCHNLALKERNQ